MKPLPLLLLVCLVGEAAVPVRLQVSLGATSVRVNANFTARIEFVDVHAAPASFRTACPVAVTLLDAGTQKSVQEIQAPPIAPGANATRVNLVLRKAGFYGIRASTTCPRIQNGLIYVRASGPPSALLNRPYLKLVAQTKGNIDVFYPQDSTSLTADGKNKAEIQVFVAPPIDFSLAFDTAATISPNPLMFAGGSGDATAFLTSTQPGDFSAVISPSSIPAGYDLHTHPSMPPMHHFLPDIEFLQVSASSQHGVPVNTPVTITVQLLDAQKRPVNAADPVAVNLKVEPGSAVVKDNPLTIASGQSSAHTSFTAPNPDQYSVDAGWGEAKSDGAAAIHVTAPIGFVAILLGGIAGGCISCSWRKKFDWRQLVYGGLAATGVWLVSGIGVFAAITAALIGNTFSAAILGALAGLAGEQVLTILVKKLFGVEEPPPAPAGAAAAPADPKP